MIKLMLFNIHTDEQRGGKLTLSFQYNDFPKHLE